VDAKEFSKWIWDVAKYVLTAIIITSFLGGFKDNKFILYLMSFVVLATLSALGIYYNNRSKKK
jgi:hypothetical protein